MLLEFAATALPAESLDGGWSFNGVRSENESESSGGTNTISVQGEYLNALLISEYATGGK